MTREEEIRQFALERDSDGDFDSNNGYQGIIEGAQWADEHPKNHWIRVEDKRPEHLKDVLVVFIEEDKPHIGIGSCYPDEYGGIYWRIDGFGLFSGRITHWKQFPELPKEEEAL